MRPASPTGKPNEAPPFQRRLSKTPLVRCGSGGFDATRDKIIQYGDSLVGRPQPMQSAYDRWERRQSVASQGDRFRLLQRQRHRSDELDEATEAAAVPVASFESYEYEGVRSQLRYEAETAASDRVDIDKLWELLLRGIAPIVIGISVGGLGWLSNAVAFRCISLRSRYTLDLLNYRSESSTFRAAAMLSGYSIFAGSSMLLAGLAATLTAWAPAAAGSGIPQVKAELNGVRVPGALDALTLAVKLIGITLVVASGLPAGREGPMCASPPASTPRLAPAGLILALLPAYPMRLAGYSLGPAWLRWWCRRTAVPSPSPAATRNTRRRVPRTGTASCACPVDTRQMYMPHAHAHALPAGAASRL